MTITAVVERRSLRVLVTYRAPSGGQLLVADLAEVWSPFEALPPVRTLASYKGQRHFAGAWWCATTGTHVGYQSWLERDHLMLMDFAADVVALSSQPCTLQLDTSTTRTRPPRSTRPSSPSPRSSPHRIGATFVLSQDPADTKRFLGHVAAEVTDGYRPHGGTDPLRRWLTAHADMSSLKPLAPGSREWLQGEQDD